MSTPQRVSPTSEAIPSRRLSTACRAISRLREAPTDHPRPICSRYPEKGYEQQSKCGFGRRKEAKMGRKVPLRCFVRIHASSSDPFRTVSEENFYEVRLSSIVGSSA